MSRRMSVSESQEYTYISPSAFCYAAKSAPQGCPLRYWVAPNGGDVLKLYVQRFGKKADLQMIVEHYARNGVNTMRGAKLTDAESLKLVFDVARRMLEGRATTLSVPYVVGAGSGA